MKSIHFREDEKGRVVSPGKHYAPNEALLIVCCSGLVSLHCLQYFRTHIDTSRLEDETEAVEEVRLALILRFGTEEGEGALPVGAGSLQHCPLASMYVVRCCYDELCQLRFRFQVRKEKAVRLEV